MSKTFSEHAVVKINEILKNHTNHVGSQLKKANPVKYKDYVASDCITMAIWVLKYAFEKTGNPSLAKRVGGLGERGTDLARFLINERGWRGVYYNPDVNHPLDGSGEHIVSYYNQVKKRCVYSVAAVPVSHKVINYSPSKIRVTPYLEATKKDPLNYAIFKRIAFGLGMSRGGSHVWLYSYGKVFESHWDRTSGHGLYTEMELTKFPWLSGIIVVPPDQDHRLTISKVEC